MKQKKPTNKVVSKVFPLLNVTVAKSPSEGGTQHEATKEFD
jgi:hypothetical protein